MTLMEQSQKRVEHGGDIGQVGFDGGINPLPDLSGIPASGTTFQKPVRLQGAFHQTLTPVSSAANPVAPPPVKLDVTYNLTGSESGTAKPPDPTSTTPGTFGAQYNLTGTITETLTIPGTTASQPLPYLPSPVCVHSSRIMYGSQAAQVFRRLFDISLGFSACLPAR